MRRTAPHVVAVVRDLISASRIDEAVTSTGGTMTRLDDVAGLPSVEAVDLLVVDWSARQPGWEVVITDWRNAAGAVGAAQPRVILFGPHTDLVAHADARAAGLGPMRARSAFFSRLPDLLATER